MSEFILLLDLNSYHLDNISAKVIEAIKSCVDRLSGDDSPLNNLWEEICVQVQGEKSFYWEIYEDTIDVYVKAELDTTPIPIKRLVSYIAQIEEGVEDENDVLVYFEDAAITALRNKIYEKAGAYQNENISAYLDEDFEVDEQYDDE